MKSLWRISNHAELNGYGGEKASGRWHTASRGKRIVYLAEHPALALIEVLVNLKTRPGLLPDVYRLLKINIERNVSESAVSLDSLSAEWRERLTETRTVGDTWLTRTDSALLLVPSAAVPESFNYLLNPYHADAQRLAVEWHKQIAFDKRLIQLQSR